jgi:flagellar biosynthesis/type III secretory pathway protein FliH
MLIKRKNIVSNKKSQNRERGQVLPLSVPAQAIQQEIQKAKQQAKSLKEEAEKILEDSKQQLEDAEKKANEIIQQAELDARDIKERVYEESVTAFNEEAEAVRAEAKSLFKDLFEVKREALMQAHEDIIKIALDLAEKIVRYQANIDPEILKTQVIESIKKATSESERVQVFVNPQDLQKLEDNVVEIEKLFPAGVSITPLSNESVDIGSCVIETKSGQLDARFSTQLMTLVKLCEHLEVAEPNIEISEDVSIPETTVQVTPFEDLPENSRAEELKINLREHEKELLEEGLLTEEEKLIVHLTDEEELLRRELLEDNFDELEKKLLHEQLLNEAVYEAEQVQVEEIPVLEEPINEDQVMQDYQPQVEEVIEEVVEEEATFAEEVNPSQGLLFEYEEDGEDDEINKPEQVDTKNILKPKKKPYKIDFNDLADEVEKNPEWKEMLDDEG